MTRGLPTFLAGFVFAFGACGAPPAPPPTPAPAVAAPAADTPDTAPTTVADHTTRLPNGLTLIVRAAQPHDQALLHLGFLVGNSFVLPGLAELALHTLVSGADASRGRPSLSTAIAQLGGFVETSVGTATSWVQIRVPAARWRAAEAALLRALEAPPQTRSQLERLRDDLVAARVDAIRTDPVRAMAEALLLVENDPAAHLATLLDRDASEVGLFRARYHRPERALFSLQVPGDPAANARSLEGAARDSLANWRPEAAAVPEPRLLPRTFRAGFYWSPAAGTDLAQVGWLQLLPPLSRVDAATLYALHACVTLDGAGGRLEQLQRERGLGHVRWRSEFVRGADMFAVLLRTEVPSRDVPQLRQLVAAARASLGDVPPNESEFALARRRAALTAGLGLLGDVTRLRVQTTLTVLGGSVELFERRLAELGGPTSFDLAAATRAYLDLPSMVVAVGGTVPADVADAQPFATLPPGFAPAPAAATAEAPVGESPWIDRASDALGGKALVRRLIGYRHEARLSSPQAPPATETVQWRADGTLQRTRELLGRKIETDLAGTSWSEQLGDQRQSLTAQEAALLRREMQRHPLALLAASQLGALTFEPVAQRTVGERDYMVLQARGDRFDRLRLYIDTVSHLVRVVEVWETLPDGTVEHLQDAWSDYRSVDGLRVPFRRVTTQDDGQNRVEAVYSSWQPLLSAP